MSEEIQKLVDTIETKNELAVLVATLKVADGFDGDKKITENEYRIALAAALPEMQNFANLIRLDSAEADGKVIELIEATIEQAGMRIFLDSQLGRQALLSQSEYAARK
mgnify:CR=1 FL=1